MEEEFKVSDAQKDPEPAPEKPTVVKALKPLPDALAKELAKAEKAEKENKKKELEKEEE